MCVCVCGGGGIRNLTSFVESKCNFLLLNSPKVALLLGKVLGTFLPFLKVLPGWCVYH